MNKCIWNIQEIINFYLTSWALLDFVKAHVSWHKSVEENDCHNDKKIYFVFRHQFLLLSLIYDLVCNNRDFVESLEAMYIQKGLND